LTINKDPNRSVQLAVQFRSSSSSAKFVGEVAITQFSREQYRWQDDGENGRPAVSNPPIQSHRRSSEYYELPPYSISVLLGKLAEPQLINYLPVVPNESRGLSLGNPL
jgi:hypothetical protein